ncbi:hypothetical protein OEA41_007697 [Lepraria neglecta]|uniref:Uncharacterized protein n=1 Tax=Lepraria neglecta TaxID=209136 RepID=A0AAD9ZFZ4_9LECA|nr:hypothetical protein OEA41_007697 [Lepraria neglecta]
MTASTQVAVFDPVTSDLRRVPFRKIDVEKYETVDVPRWKRRFDVYASNELDDADTYVVVTRYEDVDVKKSFLVRLRYNHLGIVAEVQKMISPKHRTLYIGPMPAG